MCVVWEGSPGVAVWCSGLTPLIVSRSLLAEWTRFQTTSGEKGSLLGHMGKRDSAMVLVFCEKGPEFRRIDDPRLTRAKEFGPKLQYTQAFANALVRQLMRHGGVYARALRDLRHCQASAGCEVTQLMQRRSETMATLCCGLMESAAMDELRRAQQATFARLGDYKSISVDATYKIGFKAGGRFSLACGRG